MGQADTGVSNFAELIDLASDRMGGKALAASDDFFAEKENLLKADKPVFIAGKFTERGKWMDGWESRRKREPGYDWCVVKLGQPGVVRGVNVDTSFFNGNQPEFCTVEGAELPDGPEDAAMDSGVEWSPVVDRTPLKPTSEHLIAASPSVAGKRFTHVRLNIFPDGGVARLRVYGDVVADWPVLARYSGWLELSAAKHGGLVVAANDMHFGSRHNLIMPHEAENMGDGWETRRKRGLTWAEGRPVEHDWAVVKLGHRGTVSAVEVDTAYFKGNFPESCMVEACDSSEVDAAGAVWTPLLARTKLTADTNRVFEDELEAAAKEKAVTHVRLKIYPDGGISRMRIWGRPLL
jgi:allantoicase